MSSVEVRLTYNIIGEVTERVRRAAALVVNKAALDVLAGSNASMEGIKSGRAYSRGGKLHIASAPGEAPAIDTGNLRASGYAKKVDDLTWEVGYTAEYAELLEFGGWAHQQGGMMDLFEALGAFAPMPTGGLDPRPFLRPAVAAEADAFSAAMRKVAG